MKYLISIQPPTDWTQAIVHNLNRLDWPYGVREAKDCLDFIASQGGHLATITHEQCVDVRRRILKLPNSDLRALLGWLSDPECCDPATYADLTGTPKMRAKLMQFGMNAERRRRAY